MMHNVQKPIASVILAMGLVGTSAHAATAVLDSKFKIYFLGIGVGKLNSTIAVNGNAYSMTGAAKTSGWGKVVKSATASFQVEGFINGSRVYPARARTRYRSSKKKGSLNMSFSSGNLVHHVSNPAVKYKDGAVPVTNVHFRSVLDPISAVLFPVAASGIGNGKAICNRTVPVFDGKVRMNLVFSYKSKSYENTEGFSGEVFKCAVRYRPVAGMRSFKKNVKFMKANRDLEVSLARIGDTNVYALFGFRVRTRSGVATGMVQRFKVK